MSTFDVVRLDTYRTRRTARRRAAVALSEWRRDRKARVDALNRALAITGGDRAVTAWVDEHGQGGVRVDHIVDLGADVPRRHVSRDAIDLAWEHGVPGLGDAPDRSRAGLLFFPDAPSSSAVVSLGSDGSRSWFLVVDSITPRGRLTAKQRESLMFLGGELASVVLDHDAGRLPGEESFENARSDSFAGWGVLGDLADGTVSDFERERVNLRFLVARVLKCHLDEGLSANRPGLGEQLAQVREEIARQLEPVTESVQMSALLDTLESGHLVDVADRTLDLAREMDDAGHLNAAREFYLSAFEIAAQSQAAEVAVDAAWGLGRASRKAADWSGAFRWYGIARDVSGQMGLWARHGRVLDGLGNAHRDRGNLPRAREHLDAALEVSEATEDRELRASVLHTFMTVEKLAGRHDLAAIHGWQAIRSQQDEQRRLFALMDLGGVFLESGAYEAAEDAFVVVAASVQDRDAEVLALCGLAQAAAERGDRSEFERRWKAVESAEWQKASAIIRGQVLHDCGLSWMALGDADRAGEWLGLALAFGETQGVGKLVLDAEAALERLARVGRKRSEEESSERQDAAIPILRDRRVEEVRRGLASMRETVPALVI